MLYLKQFAKKIPFIYSLNAKLKTGKTLRSYYALNEYYQREAREHSIIYREGDVVGLVKEKLAKRGVNVSPVPKGKLRIIYVGTDPNKILEELYKAYKNSEKLSFLNKNQVSMDRSCQTQGERISLSIMESGLLK